MDIFTDGLEGAEKKWHDYDMAIEAARQRIAGFQRQIDDVKRASAEEVKAPDPVKRKPDRIMADDFKTDALTARGGLLGASSGSTRDIRTEQMKKVVSETEKINKILEMINDALV